MIIEAVGSSETGCRTPAPVAADRTVARGRSSWLRSSGPGHRDCGPGAHGAAEIFVVRGVIMRLILWVTRRVVLQQFSHQPATIDDRKLVRGALPKRQ